MLNNEDLLAISCLLDTKLAPINEKFDSLNNRVDMLDKKFDSLSNRVDTLDKKFNSLDKRINMLDNRVSSIDQRLHHVELLLENSMMPRLQNIERCYVDTYERYYNGVGQIDAIQADVDLLKSVAVEHTKQIKKLTQMS